MKSRLSILLLLMLAAVASPAQVLRESVCVVEAEYTQEEKTQMGDLALWFSRKGFLSESRELSAYKSGTTGSGAVIESGSARYVLTNRHVVGYASAAKVSFILRDTTLVYEHCAVMTIAQDADLALVKLPNDCKQPALRISSAVAEDGQDIVAAGFPGLAGKPSWQITKGSVSNANLRVDKKMKGEYIQHTAPIDPGSSGGPLLYKQGDTYQIVGINTLKAFWRDNVGLAIPADAISRFITKVIGSDPTPSELTTIGINGEAWAEKVNELDEECVDSLRNMAVEMPLDVVTNTLTMECTTEIVEYFSTRKSSTMTSGTKKSNSSAKKKNKKGYADDFESFRSIRVGYSNALGNNHRFEISYERSQRILLMGYELWVGSEEYKLYADTAMSTTLGVGLIIGCQVPLYMAKKYYAIPRFYVSPYVAPLGFSREQEVAGCPLTLGCDFAFPLSDYLLSVGIHYRYAFQFFYTDNPADLILSSNRKFISCPLLCVTGQNELGISVAFSW